MYALYELYAMYLKNVSNHAWGFNPIFHHVNVLTHSYHFPLLLRDLDYSPGGCMGTQYTFSLS